LSILREEIHSAERQEANGASPISRRWLVRRLQSALHLGSVKEALLNAALESDADVLMIGRSHQPGAHGRMRDLTYAMVRHSPFPVLSV